jgi:hypothetical protein
MWRRTGPMDMSTAGIFMLAGLFTYSASLTSIVFCSAHDKRPLLIAAAAFFPVGVVHGIGVWLGGWYIHFACDRATIDLLRHVAAEIGDRSNPLWLLA